MVDKAFIVGWLQCFCFTWYLFYKVLNGDTLYGEHAIYNMVQHMELNEIPCMPGYRLQDVLPREGKVRMVVIGFSCQDT